MKTDIAKLEIKVPVHKKKPMRMATETIEHKVRITRKTDLNSDFESSLTENDDSLQFKVPRRKTHTFKTTDRYLT